LALTFAQARTILQSRIDDSSNATAVDQALNQAQREVARARRWPEMMDRAFLVTSAAYSTGTVAVDAGGTTWTLTGGVWPTDAASGRYRVSLGVSDPWYTIVTRSSDTVALTTGSAYLGSTVTASSYVAHKPHYSFPSTVDRVEEMWLHRGGHAVQLADASTDQHVTQFLHYPSGPGVPTHYLNIERDSSGNRQILLGPETPDDEYRIEYMAKRKTVDDTFSGNLDESRWPVILARASAILYEPEFYDRHIEAMRVYSRLLADEWGHESETQSPGLRVGDGRVAYPGAGAYLDNLLAYGRVDDS
jgi:hypothetical protein